jgi:hypothetical protein
MSPESKTAYEKKDASARVVFIAAGLMILLLVFVGVSAKLVLRVFSNPALTSSAASPSIPLPPEPRLEANPLESLQTLRAHEDEILNHYGWIDKSKNIVRLPIDRAIELTAERGLPARRENK